MQVARISKYIDDYEEKWDRFVLDESINGTFLQQKRFLNYHPRDRFVDASLIYHKGDKIYAVIPAVDIIDEDGAHKFISHPGSTFGGIVYGNALKKFDSLEHFFLLFNEYINNNKYDEIILKQTGSVFCKYGTELMHFFLQNNGYIPKAELGYYIDFSQYNDDILVNLSASRRRDYRYSLRTPLEFKILEDDSLVENFYEVLCNNLHKFNTNPVHIVSELLDFKNKRLSRETKFFGVFLDGELVAGAMTFGFNDRVLHTQYLAVKQELKNMFINEFLYVNIIEFAKNNGYKMLSFGTCTLNHGDILNKGLAQYKAGFGCQEYLNVTYYKSYR